MTPIRYRLLAIASILLAIISCAHSQALVHQSVNDTLGQPSHKLSYSKYISLGNGELAALVNEYNTNASPDAEGFYLVKVNTDIGGVVAGYDFHSLHDATDYGTNLYARGGYVYAVGFTTDSVLSHSILCNIIKLDAATWDTVWTISESIDSAVQQAPFSILADDSGYVYMGAAVQTTSAFKIAIVKYDAAGHRVWQSDYDSAGAITLPVAMALSGSHLAVTGFMISGGQSSFLTLPVSLATGSRGVAEFSANGLGFISHPVGIVTDTLRSSYVAGTATVLGASSVIKVIRYDSLFHQQWVRTYGDSVRTYVAAGMSMVDQTTSGRLYVTGTSPNISGAQTSSPSAIHRAAPCSGRLRSALLIHPTP